MVFCELFDFSNFWVTWVVLTLSTGIITALLSGPVFVYYYVYPTHEKWMRKSNPVYPESDKIRKEVIQTIKGLASAALCPSMSFYLIQNGYSYGYCGVEPYGYKWLFISFLIVWLGSDFYEFYYHRLGHMTDFGWAQHKFHHFFPNPTPFAVIADEYLDQFIRALPLVIFPMIMPTNVDMLYITYGVFFYGYGVALHCGHEFDCLSAHNYWINTPFQHYIHHAKSHKKTVYHTGFFIKLWDRMFGSIYDKKCICSECERKEGKRTLEIYNKVEKQDYSDLLSWRFWLKGVNLEELEKLSIQHFKEADKSK